MVLGNQHFFNENIIMKHLKDLILFILLLISFNLFAQLEINNISFEVGYGYNGAVHPYGKNFNSNFSGMNHLDLGIRYMFSEKIGAKVFYKVDSFVKLNNKNYEKDYIFNRVFVGRIRYVGYQSL